MLHLFFLFNDYNNITTQQQTKILYKQKPLLLTKIVEGPDIFEVPFRGKKIKNYLGEFVSIEVKKGGAEEGNLHQVDGITGGTITSDGVSDMLFNTLQIYDNYFSKVNSVNDTIIQSINNDNFNI